MPNYITHTLSDIDKLACTAPRKRCTATTVSPQRGLKKKIIENFISSAAAENFKLRKGGHSAFWLPILKVEVQRITYYNMPKSS